MKVEVRFDKKQVEEMLAAEITRRFGRGVTAADVTILADGIDAEFSEIPVAAEVSIDLPERGES